MISITEAQHICRDSLSLLPAEEGPFLHSLGRIAAVIGVDDQLCDLSFEMGPITS